MSEKGFLISPAFAGALRGLVDKDRNSVISSGFPKTEARFEEPIRRVAAPGSTIRLGQTSGQWPNEPPLNTKTVQLFRQQTKEELGRDPQPWEWVPDTDEYGDPVFAVTINWFSHVPVGQGDVIKWCAVVPISDMAGEYDTGQVTYNDGVESPIMRPYSKLWLLIAVEC